MEHRIKRNNCSNTTNTFYLEISVDHKYFLSLTAVHSFKTT